MTVSRLGGSPNGDSPATASRPGRSLVITGTSTDIGKTIVTAALAAALRSTGIAVCKPIQTGLRADEPGDLAVVQALAGSLPTLECVRYPDPLAPDTAARHAGLPQADPNELASQISEFVAHHEMTLIEGAGGVLVRMTPHTTILDLAAAVAAPVLVVTQPGLGALNHAELTVAAIRAAGLHPAGLVIGSWPAEPDLAMRCNRTDLPRVTGVPVVGVVPDGVGALATAEFVAAAPTWFDARWLRDLATSRARVASHNFSSSTEDSSRQGVLS